MIADPGTKPVPVIVVETDVLTTPLVGEMEVTVDAVALLTVNVRVTVPPSEFRIIRSHGPEAIPFRLKILLRLVGVSVPVIVLVIVDCPVFVRVTVEPLKPVPTISMVWEPLFSALVGERVVIVGAVTEGISIIERVTVSPSTTVTLLRLFWYPDFCSKIL
jgi:hypothetical protein